MKILILGIVLILSGCSGVILNAKYSELLDRTTALSQTTATRYASGTLTTQQTLDSLNGQATVWQEFRDARDGKVSP